MSSNLPQPPPGVLGGVTGAVGDLTGGVVSAVGDTVGGAVSAVTDVVSAVSGAVTGTTATVVAAPAAEAGQTTSEFKMAAVHSLLIAVFGALAAYGIGVPAGVQNIIVAAAPIAIAIIGAGYSISRGLRKRGTA
jgi:uncharacterized membrane-anchored protein